MGRLETNFSDFLYRNSNIFIQVNAFESVVCEMVAILSRGDELNSCGPSEISVNCYNLIYRGNAVHHNLECKMKFQFRGKLCCIS